MPKKAAAVSVDRRHFMMLCSAAGVGATLFPGVLWAKAQDKKITRGMIDEAATIAGVDITDEQKKMMLDGLNEQRAAYEKIRALKIPNSVPPALDFNPLLPGMEIKLEKGPMRASSVAAEAAPPEMEQVAFYSTRRLAELIRSRQITSTALTKTYLSRLKRYDPVLRFIINLTEERALKQAAAADAEIAAGKYRGFLHGLPWGAKDLLAVKGYPTTWGAGGFEKQVIDEDATVVQRLDAAGAVLVGKTTLGALAMGDKWFGGMTRNPWKLDQGSSGSSAGSASATAAGCVAFSIGTETLGSISSPSTRCGTTGLRPTFGRTPRTGGMALTWSMDKIGPICRTVEDCALVFDAIYGPDGKDRTVHNFPFTWDSELDIRKLRIGYFKKSFQPPEKPDPNEKPEDKARREEAALFDQAALNVLRDKMSVNLIEVELPEYPWFEMIPLLVAEAAAAFDELTMTGRDKLLTEQSKDDWPNSFRVARFYPAVEYVQANRARMMGMQAAAKLFEQVDVIATPTESMQLVMTNYTGHPAVILPNGFRQSDGTPVSFTFLGNLFREDQVLAVAKAYQDATEWHLKYPQRVMDEGLKAKEPAKS